jgi:hypothetical protein
VIELQMVHRMVKKGLLLAPLLIAALWLWNGWEYAFAGAVGLAMTLLNLWIAGKVIGSIAEHSPRLLLAGAMVAFTLGLAVLTGIAFALRAADVVYFPVTGITLVGSHIVLVLWEAAATYKLGPNKSPVHHAHT